MTEGLLEIFKFLLPLLAVVAGWFVASRFQDKRERRKEIRTLIDETKSLIEKSYKATLGYYSRDNKTPINALSAEIKYLNLLISEYFLVLNQAGLKTGGSDEIIAYTKLSSGDVFETKDFKERYSDDEWRASLTAAAQELTVLLDKRYFDTFRISGFEPTFSEIADQADDWPNERWF